MTYRYFTKILFFFVLLNMQTSMFTSEEHKSTCLNLIKSNISEHELAISIPMLVSAADLAQKDFLPSQYAISYTDKISKSQASAILTYLATFQESNPKRSPFIKEDQKIFDEVKRVEKRTQWWLGKGQAIILGTALSPLIGFAALSPEITGTQALIAISVATTFAGVANSGLAFYATGTLPDGASRKANDRQNKYAQLERSYERLAHVWVDMHFSDKPEMKKHAREIACNMDKAYKPLQASFKEKMGYDHADALLCPIREVDYYILNQKKLGVSPLLKGYIIVKEGQDKLNKVS